MNVVELETNVLLAYAALLIFIFLLMVALSYWQYRQKMALIRELENRRIKRIIDMAEQIDAIEAVILRNKLSGDFRACSLAKQIVAELNKNETK
jgi:cbb3-type cytochrome oxidase subunit 3